MLTPCCASLRCSCQGSRPDESLDMDLALPLFQPHPAPEPQHLKNQGGLLPGRLGAATDISPVPRINTPTLLPGQSLHPPPLWPLSYLYTPNPLKHEEKGRIFFCILAPLSSAPSGSQHALLVKVCNKVQPCSSLPPPNSSTDT